MHYNIAYQKAFSLCRLNGSNLTNSSIKLEHQTKTQNFDSSLNFVKHIFGHYSTWAGQCMFHLISFACGHLFRTDFKNLYKIIIQTHDNMWREKYLFSNIYYIAYRVFTWFRQTNCENKLETKRRNLATNISLVKKQFWTLSPTWVCPIHF